MKVWEEEVLEALGRLYRSAETLTRRLRERAEVVTRR